MVLTADATTREAETLASLKSSGELAMCSPSKSAVHLKGTQ